MIRKRVIKLGVVVCVLSYAILGCSKREITIHSESNKSEFETTVPQEQPIEQSTEVPEEQSIEETPEVSQEQPEEETPEESVEQPPVEQPTEEPQEQLEVQPTREPSSSDTTQVIKPGEATSSTADFSQYSTKAIPFGVGSKFDQSTNIPKGLEWYKVNYSNYAADFIMEHSNKIWLTFDEGYEKGYTASILDTLLEKDVKATFFITLPYAKENPDLVNRMIQEGHIIGNHTVTHPKGGMAPLPVERQVNEIMELHNYVVEKFGYEMTLFRFPTGVFSEQNLAVVQSLGYRSVFWSFAYKDWLVDAQPDEAESLTTCVNRLHPGAIYLLHAVSSTNTHILGDFIDAAKEKGYEFK